jgi:hypothetical protein
MKRWLIPLVLIGILILCQCGKLNAGVKSTDSLDASAAPATPEAERILKKTYRIQANIKDTDYVTPASIDEAAGKYHLTCGVLVNLVIENCLPRHFEKMTALNGGRKFGSSSYYRVLSAEPFDTSGQNGWQQLRSPADVRPGDIIAWFGIDPETGRRNSHVLVVDSLPGKTIDGEFKIKVIDSTFRGHKMSPAEKTQVGIGTGFMWFHVDEGRKIDGYRWSGEFYSLVKPVLDGKSSITILRAVALK